MLKNYLVAGMGGAIGVMLRLFLGKCLPTNVYGMPSYILLVNALGCLILGLIIEYFAFAGHFPSTARYFLITGFLGGMTTFSAYVLEIGLILERNQYLMAFLYTSGSVISGFVMFICGVQLIRWIVH